MFKLQFKTDNAAFEEAPWSEIARILRNVADRLEQGVTEGRAVDCNGNSVGSFYWDMLAEGR